MQVPSFEFAPKHYSRGGHVNLGRHSTFPDNAVDKGDTVVGSFCSIAEHVYFHGPDNHACKYDKNLVASFDMGKFGAEFTPSGQGQNTWVGNDVWIGTGAKILSGVVISDGAIIGAHAVITKNVPPYAVVVGNPARIAHFRFDPETIIKLLDIKWWGWSDDEIKERIKDFKDVEGFIKKYWRKND